MLPPQSPQNVAPAKFSRQAGNPICQQARVFPDSAAIAVVLCAYRERVWSVHTANSPVWQRPEVRSQPGRDVLAVTRGQVWGLRQRP